MSFSISYYNAYIQEVMAMDAKQFQEIFGRFDHPALLKTDKGWLTNPAAQALALSPADLEQL